MIDDYDNINNDLKLKEEQLETLKNIELELRIRNLLSIKEKYPELITGFNKEKIEEGLNDYISHLAFELSKNTLNSEEDNYYKTR